MDLGQLRLFCSVCFIHTFTSGRQFQSVYFANLSKISVHLIFRHSNAVLVILLWDTTFVSAQKIHKICKKKNLPILSESLTTNTFTAAEWKYIVHLWCVYRNRAWVEMVRQNLCKRTFASCFQRITRCVFNLC